jgi:hypothetical protein
VRSKFDLVYSLEQFRKAKTKWNGKRHTGLPCCMSNCSIYESLEIKNVHITGVESYHEELEGAMRKC